MDALQALRELALTYAPTADYPVCLDREKRLEILALRQQYQAKHDKLQALDDSDRAGDSLGDEPIEDRLARELAEIEARMAEAEDAAKDVSVVLIFKRLPATPDSADEGEASFSEIEAACTRRPMIGGPAHPDDGKVDYEAVGDALMSACYLRTDSIHGDLGLTWHEASRQLDSTDLQWLRSILLGHHRTGARIPFDPRSSGLPETT